MLSAPDKAEINEIAKKEDDDFSSLWIDYSETPFVGCS